MHVCVCACVFLNSCLKIPYTIAVYLKVYFTLTCDINMVRNHFDSGGRSLFDDLRALLLRLDSSVKFPCISMVCGRQGKACDWSKSLHRNEMKQSKKYESGCVL